jgi:hypothetical protein
MINNMQLRMVELSPEISGKLYLHSMPGRNETLDTFLMQETKNEIDLVACLSADEELSRLSPDYALCVKEDTFPFKSKEFCHRRLWISFRFRKFPRLRSGSC